MDNPSIHIIGFGKVGKALSVSFKSNGWERVAILKKGKRIDSLSEFNFITVPDSEIRNVATSIVNQFDDFKGKFFFHTSGVYPASILKPIEDRGGVVGCFHPLMAVSAETTSFKDVYFDLEGSDEAIKNMEEIAKVLGAKSFKVDASEKELLHASAVMASNYLVTLADLALRISASSNIPERTLQSAMLPLMNSALTNLETQNPSKALTGPISRGDIQTVQKHLKLLKGNQEILDMYKKLGLLTLELIGEDLKDNTVKFRLYDLLK